MSKRTSFNKQDERRKSNVHGDLLLCGELKKKSSVPPKRYQTRYFEAIGHYLNYYQDESKSTLKGTLDMDDCVACELDGLKVVLVMNSSDGHRVKLKAENAAYAKHWYEGLNVLTKEQDEDEDSDPDEDEDKKDKKGKKKKKKPLPYPPDRPDVVWFSLTVLKAKDLTAKDFGGTSDPYIVASVDEPDVSPKKARCALNIVPPSRARLFAHPCPIFVCLPCSQATQNRQDEHFLQDLST
jgi:hypothetical protein